ncbi:leucine-rich repeat domain-containing protein [Flavobacterium acetivorans]|uniref:leucine-rich repeat domain-containing protein n=1 Tax=Flavobacterium acetivorans TaxID=2893883 RepID=UPI001E4E9A0B|nr:hypothetical protein [Flavobacterium sp. F-29]UFH35073.1 hypothetical protein LNP19_13415 [Flavobacterium sp. F-29]
MKTNTFSNKKNRIITRFVLLFTALTVSQISYSCFKEKNVSPVYSEIPDANFKAYLKTIVPNAFTPDNKFISNHPSVVSYNERISVTGKNITSLSGIEYFTSLTRLDCPENKLTSIDLSKNRALTVLFCGSNQLTTLDISRNVNLTKLGCSDNQLTTLDISKNTNLTWLNCVMNQLITINLGENNVLRTIFCYNNQLTNLDISNNTNLTRLECYKNKLITLDISKNKSLTMLYCYYNKLTCLDVSNNNSLVILAIDEAIKCCHPSIKAFCDRRGDLLTGFARIPPFTCP